MLCIVAVLIGWSILAFIVGALVGKMIHRAGRR